MNKWIGLLLFIIGMGIVALSLLNRGTFVKACPTPDCQTPVFAKLDFTYDDTAKTMQVVSPAATITLQACAYENARNWQCQNPLDNMPITMQNGRFDDSEPRTKQVGGVVYRVNKWLSK